MIYVKLFRLNNWVKNLFIFLPLFFSGEFFNHIKFINTFYVTLGFSLVTGFIYIINDIFDIEFDKIHPEKRNRPIPSGKISIKQSLILGICLLLLGLTGLWKISIYSFFLSIFYVLLNFLYSIKLKQIPILDFIIVASGFVIRIIIGSEIGNLELTQWMIIMVFLLSLFIAVSKRRDDVYQYELNNKIHRKVVSEYTVNYMDRLITIISSVLLVSYLMLIFSEIIISKFSSEYLIVSFVFVLIGVFRYNQLTYVKNKSGSPIDIFFKDRFLIVIVLLWFLTFYSSLYI